MEPALLKEVTSLDLADITSGDAARKQQFVKDLGAAFTNIGFVAIKNHGLSDALRSDLYENVKQFFSLPDEVKKKYEFPELFGQRGYIGKGKETAKGFKVADLKEFYHVGQPEPIGQMPSNIFPDELHDF